jgi:hypothetical protein
MTRPLHAAAIVDVLKHHHGNVVRIGAFAAISQHASIPATGDIDLTPESSLETPTRLSTALQEPGAPIRTDALDERLRFDHDGRSLAASSG